MAHALADGFAALSVAKSFKQSAQDNLARWLEDPLFAPYRPQLDWLIEQQQWSGLLDRFYRMLPFGTGGRRGPVGIGVNRFNAWTLALSVQGHIAYLRERFPQQDLSVVIAYDVRVFNDLRGLYNAELPLPLMGMTSRDFAQAAAGVYTANGVRVWMLADAAAYMSTPELSFAIRYLKAHAGLNISASHNHPDDNGGKFYNERGGQEVPPHDEAMVRQVERVTHVEMPDFAAAKATGLISWIDPEVHEAYVSLNVEQSLAPAQRQARVVFTPLHGTADTSVGAVLQRAGFEVETVAEQATHDGAFPAVPYRAPNPEVPESMQLGMERARESAADLVMSCDPDADRIGICSRTPDGDYQFLTGNEIAVLITHYKLDQLQRLGQLPDHPLVIKTEVTTELLRPITEQCGGHLVGDLLVGFKYHGNVLAQLEQQGRFQHANMPAYEGGLDDFIIGVEESHGILVTPEVRDKDAAGAGLLLAELAAMQHQQGLTLLDYLDDIYRRYGYYANLLTSMVMTGAEGLTQIQTIQDTLRQQPPQQIAGYQVTEVVDHWDEGGLHGAFLSETDRASRNMLSFRLDNGARAIIRPSGTEPKNKIYIEAPSDPLGEACSRQALAQQKAEANAVAQDIADDFTRQMLAIIDVHLPDYALRVSGLVPLDKRMAFAEDFMPDFEAQIQAMRSGAATADAVSAWIDDSLASYGKDARGLVRDAVRAYVEAERQQAGATERREALDAMERVFFAPSA